ncbi:MAG: hypothetical protein M3N93_10390 [Acidobacteriota bacterium]|nr:hypothetical protein [Acidobacteriota bacterium]
MRSFLLFLAVSAAAAVPAGYSHWTQAQLDERAKTLPARTPAKPGRVRISLEPLGGWGNHSMSLIHREGSGEAELHETESDILFIRSGDAAIVIGGSMPGSRRTTTHELRGPKIEGGETQALHAGDVLHISPKTPHQIVLEPGAKLDYYAVKVAAR